MRVMSRNFGWVFGKEDGNGTYAVTFENTSNTRVGVSKNDLENGAVVDPSLNVLQVGNVFSTGFYGDVEVVKYISSKRVVVRFFDTGNTQEAQKDAVLKGYLRDKTRIATASNERRTRSEEFFKALETSREVKKRTATEKARQAAAAARKMQVSQEKSRAEVALRTAQAERKRLERQANKDMVVEVKPQGKPRKDVIEVDFKDRDGNWVLYFRDKATDVFTFTRLGKLYNNVTQRTRGGGSLQIANPCYEGVTLALIWSDPNNFCDWVVQQSGWGLNYQLDKDLLHPERRQYGPDTCVFLPREINTTIANGCKKSYFRKSKNGWVAEGRFGGKEVLIGEYPTEDGAKIAYREFFKKFMGKLAQAYSSTLCPKSYQKLCDISTFEV